MPTEISNGLSVMTKNGRSTPTRFEAAPITNTERIQQIDIIRGFALFGVLWINLVTQSHTLAPAGAYANLPTAWLDAIIAPIASTLVSGKAMALFSLLFGYGFAMIMSRLEARGANAGRIFLRRILILFAFGLVHIWLIWLGDILHAYALMGLVLFATRAWSDRMLLIVGLALALFSTAAVELLLQSIYGEPFPWWATLDAGAQRRFLVMQDSDYVAYVAELWRASWQEMWGPPDYVSYLTVTLGRFMLGAWIFRQGWLQHTQEYAAQFRRWSIVLVGSGMALALATNALYRVSDAGGFMLEPLPQLVLGLGYGAWVVVLCRDARWRRGFAGIAAVGRMALTNYLAQSLVYVFVLYGFGLGLLSMLGATMCLTIAVLTFAVQIVFSRWWLTRFRFGPAEWLWRSLTYGRRQPIRA